MIAVSSKERAPPSADQPPGSVVRVVVCGAVRPYRSALAAALHAATDIDVVAELGCTAAAGLATTPEPADVFVADTRWLRELRQRWTLPRPASPAQLVAVLVKADASEIQLCVQASARGLVHPDATVEIVGATVRRVFAGEFVCAPELLDTLVNHAADTGRGGRTRLTSREEEVLRAIGEGLSNKQIARELGIRLPTVKNHVHSILTKLGVEKREEALLYSSD
jgi:two-component system, NarL family, nitrate/nitrite response regulator NarL